MTNNRIPNGTTVRLPDDGSTPIITYQHAYVGGHTSLCQVCERDEIVRDHFPALGPVSHGQHDGSCDGCRWLARRAARAQEEV